MSDDDEEELDWLIDVSNKQEEKPPLPNPQPIHVDHWRRRWRLGNSVYMTRAIKRISQQDLADAVGVSRQTIAAVEVGRHEPSIGLAMSIAKELGSPVESLFSLQPSVRPIPRWHRPLRYYPRKPVD